MYVQVVVDAPLAQPLDYLLPESLAAAGESLVGRCCAVPLGRRKVAGLIVGHSAQSALPAARLRPLAAITPLIPALASDWLVLTRFAADYYQQAWGETAIPALPPALRTVPGPRFVATVDKLRKRRLTAEASPQDAPPLLTPEQQAASAAIRASSGFSVFLLFGVTGSGKTEVYLDAIAAQLAAQPQAQALLLVPEINLTPQLLGRLRNRFADEPIVAMHSGMAAVERSAAWLAAHEGRARIVVGTRLAVFASLPALALIVVDEEHDASYKAGDGARYSARDLAIKRAHLADVPVVLGSATPSLESWAHASAGKYTLLSLRQRAGASARWPTLTCLDTRQYPPLLGLAAPVRSALAETHQRGDQSLVFINRRGYAPVIACEACGWLSTCPRCAVFAAFHKPDGTLRCHHCGWQSALPRACPTCGNQDLKSVGHGTQRIEEALRETLPGASIARIDRDTTQRRGAADAAFGAMHAGAVDVLVGTQMITKGHDFRRVTLVVVLNADAQLVSHDFRAPERLFATLVQVAGRAGRSGLPSRVLVQTRFPQHPLFAYLARLDYAGFADQQLQERHAARLPPAVAHALLTVEARAMQPALAFLAAARELVSRPAIRCYDPVPMPLSRLADLFRAQLLVEADSRAQMQMFLEQWLRAVRQLASDCRPRLRWQIEVDPLQI